MAEQSQQAQSMALGRAPYDVANEQSQGLEQPMTDQSQTQPAGDGLDDLTKDELLQEAEARGVEVKTSASKADILAALRSQP